MHLSPPPYVKKKAHITGNFKKYVRNKQFEIPFVTLSPSKNPPFSLSLCRFEKK
jgi:hypothetical protein